MPRRATAATQAGVAREAAAYETNLYRLCGDWLKGTETLAPDRELVVPPEGLRWQVGGRSFELREWRGHTDSDLVLVDRASGVVFAGGLVFSRRVPTTPHAQVPAWLASLDALQALPGLAQAQVVPSHGPVHRGPEGLEQTRRYLRWLDGRFRDPAVMAERAIIGRHEVLDLVRQQRRGIDLRGGRGAERLAVADRRPRAAGPRRGAGRAR